MPQVSGYQVLSKSTNLIKHSKKVVEFLGQNSTKIIFVLLFIEVLPFLIYQENLKLYPYDFLDGTYAYSSLLIKYKYEILTKANFYVPEFLGGQNSTSLWGAKSIYFIWIWLFGPFYGYVCSKIIMIFVAFWGTYLFLTHFLISDNKTLCLWMAYFYSVIPFWGYDLSQAGVPLFFYVFFMLRKEISIKNSILLYLILVFLAFYSSLILSGFFVLVTLFILELVVTYKVGKFNFKVILGFSIVSISYIFSHWALFDEYIFHPIKNNRMSFVFTYTGLTSSIEQSIKSFKYGIYTATDNHVFIIYFSSIVLIIMFLNNVESKKILMFLLYIILSCFVYGFLQWKCIKFIHQIWIQIVPMDLTRFVFLNGFFWICIFSLSINFISKIRKGIVLAFFAILIQVIFTITSNLLFVQNYFQFSIKEYYSEKLFTLISKEIDKSKDKYRVISLGLPPAIALYNGYYCLDGYSSSYSLNHKLAFDKIVEKELNLFKEPLLTGGNKLYAISSELINNLEVSASNQIEIKFLRYNIEQLKLMNCKYLFSAVKINTQNNPHFKLIKLYTDKDSYWKIYVYQIV